MRVCMLQYVAYMRNQGHIQMTQVRVKVVRQMTMLHATITIDSQGTNVKLCARRKKLHEHRNFDKSIK